MKRLSHKKGAFFALALFALIAAAGGVFVFNRDSFFSGRQLVRTPSGLKILFFKDNSLPFVQFRAFFPKAGADYDEKGQSGLASLTAFLSEQGAGDLSSSALQEKLNQLGTELEISVGRQNAVLALGGLSWHGEKLWDLFYKVSVEPLFQEEELNILRKQLLNSRLSQLDSPDFVAQSVWRQRLFEGPVGQSRNGTLISLSKISLEGIKRFYKSRYLEGEPFLIVTGQYDKKLKRRIISDFSASFAFQNQSFKPLSPPDLEPEFKLLSNKRLVQAEIRLGYSLGPFAPAHLKRHLAFLTANNVLGGAGLSSRLAKGLREERGLTYHVDSSLAFGKLYGVFSVEGSTKTASVREFLEQTLLILKKFREKGITLDEFKRAKQNLKSRYLKRAETPEGRADLEARYIHYLGVSPQFLKNYLPVLESLSLDEAHRIIEEFVLSKPLQVLIYGHPSLEAQLEGLKGLPPLQTISFEEFFKEELSLKNQLEL